MSGQDWRIETNAGDYFGNQKKKAEVEARRPVIRKASDLVGPGIADQAVRITDFNDELATFNGTFSAADGALNSPAAGAFIGTVLGDAELGGEQRFRSLVSGNEYTRVFVRNPGDAASIAWGAWTTPEALPASVFSQEANLFANPSITPVTQNEPTALLMPKAAFVGNTDTFAVTTSKINVLRPGQYAGYLWFSTVMNDYIDYVDVFYPLGDKQASDRMINMPGAWGVRLPIHFYTTNTLGFVSVEITQSVELTTDAYFWRIHLTRLGDVS